MSFIGCWNTSQNFKGEHKGYLPEGSVTVKSFFVSGKTDEEVIERAKEMSKEHDYFLISVSYLSGVGPNYDRRELFRE